MMVIKNWKTTLCGVIAAAAQGVAAKFPEYAVISEIVSAAAIGALGFCSKDRDVTGGTVSQTDEASVRVVHPDVIIKAAEVTGKLPTPPRSRP